MWKACSSLRQSTISDLCNTVLVHMPTGKAWRWRSSGQPEASIGTASARASRNPTWRWLTSTSEWGRGLRAASSSAMIRGAAPSSASSSHSSGPSQSAARSPATAARQASMAGSTPKAAATRPMVEMRPRKTSRESGASGCSAPDPASSCCSNAVSREATASGIEPLPFRIDEDRAHHLHRDHALRHRHVKRLAETGPPARHHGERDAAVEGGADIGGGHMADHWHRDWRLRVGDDLRALFQQGAGIVGEEADELLALRVAHGGTRQRTLADEILLCLADRP